MINRLAVIGVGLIGASLALALKQAAVVGHVVGCGRSEKNLQKGIELGVIDSSHELIDHFLRDRKGGAQVS